MGEAIRITCEHCGAEIYLEEGITDMMAPWRFNIPPSTKDSAWDIEDDNIKKIVYDLIKNKNAKIVEFENCLSEDDEQLPLQDNEEPCYKCAYGYKIYVSETGEIFNLFDFTLVFYDEGSINMYKPIYKDSLGNVLQPISLDEVYFSFFDDSNRNYIKCYCCKKHTNIKNNSVVINFY